MVMPNNSVAVTYYFSSLRNTRMSFTWYWLLAGTAWADQNALDSAADDAFSQFASMWVPLGDDDAMCLGTQLVLQVDASHQRVGYSSAASVSGGILLVDSLPDNMALVIRKVTGIGGRQNRGRVFIPCISEGAVNDGYIEPARVGDVKNIADYFGADQTFNAVPVHSRHWNRKNSLMQVISVAYGLSRLYSKIKRLRHEYPAVIH